MGGGGGTSCQAPPTGGSVVGGAGVAAGLGRERWPLRGNGGGEGGINKWTVSHPPLRTIVGVGAWPIACAIVQGDAPVGTACADAGLPWAAPGAQTVPDCTQHLR